MIVIASEMRVIGKNYRSGTNSKGPWEMYELQVANGEGMAVTMNCTEEIYNEVQTFTPYTAKIDLRPSGYSVRGDVQEIWAE